MTVDEIDDSDQEFGEILVLHKQIECTPARSATPAESVTDLSIDNEWPNLDSRSMSLEGSISARIGSLYSPSPTAADFSSRSTVVTPITERDVVTKTNLPLSAIASPLSVAERVSGALNPSRDPQLPSRLANMPTNSDLVLTEINPYANQDLPSKTDIERLQGGLRRSTRQRRPEQQNPYTFDGAQWNIIASKIDGAPKSSKQMKKNRSIWQIQSQSHAQDSYDPSEADSMESDFGLSSSDDDDDDDYTPAKHHRKKQLQLMFDSDLEESDEGSDQHDDLMVDLSGTLFGISNMTPEQRIYAKRLKGVLPPSYISNKNFQASNAVESRKRTVPHSITEPRKGLAVTKPKRLKASLSTAVPFSSTDKEITNDIKEPELPLKPDVFLFDSESQSQDDAHENGSNEEKAPMPILFSQGESQSQPDLSRVWPKSFAEEDEIDRMITGARTGGSKGKSRGNRANSKKGYDSKANKPKRNHNSPSRRPKGNRKSSTQRSSIGIADVSMQLKRKYDRELPEYLKIAARSILRNRRSLKSSALPTAISISDGTSDRSEQKTLKVMSRTTRPTPSQAGSSKVKISDGKKPAAMVRNSSKVTEQRKNYQLRVGERAMPTRRAAIAAPVWETEKGYNLGIPQSLHQAILRYQQNQQPKATKLQENRSSVELQDSPVDDSRANLMKSQEKPSHRVLHVRRPLLTPQRIATRRDIIENDIHLNIFKLKKKLLFSPHGMVGTGAVELTQLRLKETPAEACEIINKLENFFDAPWSVPLDEVYHSLVSVIPLLGGMGNEMIISKAKKYYSQIASILARSSLDKRPAQLCISALSLFSVIAKASGEGDLCRLWTGDILTRLTNNCKLMVKSVSEYNTFPNDYCKCPLIESFYICCQLSDIDLLQGIAGSPIDSQWTTIYLWCCCCLDLEADGVKGKWGEVNRINNSILHIAGTTHDFTDATDMPVRLQLHRCLHLLHYWNWPVDATATVAIYKYFAAKRFSSVDRDIDQFATFPRLLHNTNDNVLTIKGGLRDSSFVLFLKIMARTVKSLSKKDSTKVLLLTPNNRIEYSENEELPMSKLVSLRNEYSILFTRKFFSNSFAMKLDDEQLEQRVILEGSHIKAREVSLSAWKLNIEWELSHSQIIPHSCHSWLSAIIRVSVGDLKRVLDHKELGSDSMRKVNLDTYERFLCLCIKSVEFVTKVAGQQGYKLLTSDICGLLNIEGCEALHSLVLGYIEVIFSLVNIDKKQLCLRWKLEAIRPFESYLNSLFCTNSSHGELSRAMDIAVRALYQSVLYGDDTWDTILYKHDLRTIVSIEGEYLLRVYYPVWCSKLIDQDAVLRYSQTMKDLFYRCLVRAEIKNEKPFLIQMEPLTWVNTADQDTMSIDRLGRDDIVGRRPRMINNLISMSLSECKSFLKMARQETEDMIATLRRSSISLYHEKYFAHRQLLKMVVSNVNSTWGDDVEGLAWFKSTLPFVSEGATMTSFSSNVVSKMGDLESPSTQTYFVTYFLGVYEKALLESQIPEFEDHFAQLLLSSKGSAALHFFTNYLVPGFIIAGKRRNRLTAPLLNILTRVADSDGNFTFRHVGRRFFYWLPSSMTQDKCIKDALQFMICLIRRHYGTSTDLSEWSQYLFNIVESAIGINNPGGYSSEYRISDRLQSDINAFVDKLKLRNDTHLWEFGNNVIDEKTKISLSLDMAKDFQGEFFVLISLLTRQRFSWLDAMLDAGLKSFFADENQREQVKCAIYPSDRVSTFLESCII